MREIIALTYGMLTMVDDAVGRVLARLDALGLADDTVIAFTSDHGDWMGDHRIMLKGPLHYQGLLRVPFIWADPQQAAGHGGEHGAGPGSGQHRGQWFAGLASTIDIPATFLDRAGLAPYNGIQGHSLLDSIADPATGSVAGRTGLLIEEDALRPNFGYEERPRVRTLVTERYRLSVWSDSDWGVTLRPRRRPPRARQSVERLKRRNAQSQSHGAARARDDRQTVARSAALGAGLGIYRCAVARSAGGPDDEHPTPNRAISGGCCSTTVMTPLRAIKPELALADIRPMYWPIRGSKSTRVNTASQRDIVNWHDSGRRLL